jgi:hypothetical protein
VPRLCGGAPAAARELNPPRPGLSGTPMNRPCLTAGQERCATGPLSPWRKGYPQRERLRLIWEEEPIEEEIPEPVPVGR